MLHKSIVERGIVTSADAHSRSPRGTAPPLHRLRLLPALPSPSFLMNKIKRGIKVNFLELTHISEQLRVPFS